MPFENKLSTAKICAFARAYHSKNNMNKVFDDYLAYDLIGEEDYNNLYQFITKNYTADFIRNYLKPVTLPRIAFAENKLETFAKQYGICQYVICGAGYDTFSFRNNNPNIEIFEVDHPNMQSFKRERIESLQWDIPHKVHFVKVDFEKDNFIQRLIGSGFNPNVKTFFSILGVAYYLTLPVFAKTVSYISEIAAPYSMLVFDYPNEILHRTQGRVHKLSLIAKELGEIMQGGYYFEDLCDALRSEDFRLESHLAPSDIDGRFFEQKTEGLSAIKGIYIASALKKENSNYYI